MKKLIYCALALAAGLFATSCQQENLEPVAQEGTVTYTVEVPEVMTKAIGDGTNVNSLVYEVWKTDEAGERDLAEGKTGIRLYQKTINLPEGAPRKWIVTLNLVKNQNYTVLFWAQNAEAGAYNTSNLTSVTYKNTYGPENTQYFSNQEGYAAFYHAEFISETSPRSKRIELRRPFAQVNIATTNSTNDGDGAKLYEIKMTSSKVTIKNVPTVFNVAGNISKATAKETGEQVTNGATPSTTTFVFDEAYLPNCTSAVDAVSTHNVAGQPYEYAAMNYIFANGTVEVTYEINTILKAIGGSTSTTAKVVNTIYSVPVEENYRTNIVGNLLTSTTEYEVIVDADWAGADLAPEALYLAAANGGEVTLTEDVVLEKPLDIKADMALNLNGKTITGALNVAPGANVTIENGVITNGDKTVSGITTNGILTLNNVQIVSARHAVRVESGKVVINGGTYKIDPISNSTLHALNVGDNNTMAEVIIKGGTFIGPKGTSADSGSAVNVRTGSKVVIEGGDFSGGKTKTVSCAGEITIVGGSFDQDPSTYVANGYKAVSINGSYHVLPEVVAEAATAANVTAVTESTAAVATALGTDNGEATMFIWNDVAYIAKYGEVVITSAADEATTVRGVVEYAEGLTTATVAEGIEVVGNRTFRKCANLETVVFPNTLTEIGPAVFQSCSKLANVTIPASVTTIGEGAFAECTSLTSINIPAGVIRIEADALRATGLVSVEFHEGVTYFGAQAFRDCKQLKEVIINAPEFTVEANAFGVMAGPLPGTTIYVANAEMKAYLESTLAYKNQFTIVAPTVPETGAAADEALRNGENVSLASDLIFSAKDTEDTGYGKVGLNVNGSVLNGNGHTITANDAWATWDCTISAVSGTIKNATISGAMRGIFMPGANGDVYINNVTFDNVIYTFNSDAGNKNYGVYISNTILNGWTSFSDVHKEVVFTNCSFGEGNGYAFCRPYNACVFENCEFSTDMEFDTTKQANIVFKNCTYGGVKITAENAASLKTGDVTFFYNGVGTVSFE